MTAVIPAYRRPDMVERALRSVLAQARPPAEVIVVDDASGDETGPRAAALGARVIAHEHNLGPNGARNTGLEAASHEWIALLDSDDEWLPHHLATLWEARDGHVLVGSAALGAGDDARHHRVHGWTGRRPLPLQGPARVTRPENLLTSSSILLRTDTARAVGGFPGLRHAEDLDMWLRMLERGTGSALPTVTAILHLHGDQPSIEPERLREAHTEVLRAYADRPWCTPALLRRHEGRLAWDAARSGSAPMLRSLTPLTNPQRALGAAQLLAGRFRGRRIASRLGPDGVPSTAILPGVAAPPDNVPGPVDLRGRTLPGALLRLLRRPTSRALVAGPASAVLVRALGIEPRRQP